MSSFFDIILIGEKIMKIIFKNDYDLKEEDIDEVVKRVKLILRNSSDELLLGYSANVYQFPGGHVEEGEDLIEALNREIEEEVGINLSINDIVPFAKRIAYYKDYPEEGKNRKNEIYYYEYVTDSKPDLSKTNYTQDEKLGNFELRYIPVDRVIEELSLNRDKNGDIRGIATEMLEVLEEYL